MEMEKNKGLRLSDILKNSKSKTQVKRVGRGIGSGTGKTSGSGHKGQKARRGNYSLEGGQTPVHLRIPKRGGGAGSDRFRRKTFETKADFLENILAKKKIDVSINSETLVNFLREVLDIPHYYKRVKIIGEGKEKFFTDRRNLPRADSKRIKSSRNWDKSSDENRKTPKFKDRGRNFSKKNN